MRPHSLGLRRSPGRKLPAARAVSLLALLAASGCSAPAPPPTPQVAIAPPPVAPAPEGAPLTPARWVDSSGATLIGPEVAGGTLVLLGGRRAIVAKDGTTRVETAPTSEGLLEIIEVPTARGDRRIVGRGLHTLFRFDDPLGAPVALARSDVLIDHIGAGPGMIAVWDFQSYVPRFIDIETGQSRTLPSLPALPLRAVAFRNAKEGAGAFEAAGLAITADGGATWRLASDTGSARDALRVTGLRLQGDTVRAFVFSNGPDAAVDIAAGRLGRLTEPPEPSKEPALLRWIRVTERDPLEAAAAAGVESPSGGVVVASHGLIARIDPMTGAILELSEYSKGPGLGPCAVSRAGSSTWMGCVLSGDSDDFAEPFGVLRLPLSAGKLTPERPVVLRNGETAMRTSPSGGAMILAPCSADDEGDVCVRQPDGKWASIAVGDGADLWKSGAGPLADGRIAVIVGLDVSDAAFDELERLAPSDESQSEGAEEGEAAEARRRPRILAIGRNGKPQRLATLSISDPAEASLRVQSPIEEDENHTLRFVLTDDESVYAVVQPPGQKGVGIQRVAQATQASIHAGRGLAVGENRVMASIDGGDTWVEAAAPTRVREAITDLGPVGLDEMGIFVVSEVGAKVDTQLRIGWGHADAVAEPRTPEPKITLASRPSPPAAPEKTLVCSTTGAAPGVSPPLSGPYEVMGLFYKGGKPPPVAKGQRRSTSTAQAGRAGMLDALAVLEEQGFDKKGELPKTWTIHWIDPAEVGAKPRSWTGPPPKGTPWGSNLRTAAASGGRALFALRAGNEHMLVRVKPGGTAEMTAVPYDLLPTADVSFGTDKGEPIAWVHENAIVVWVAGEAPRVIASLQSRAMKTVGQPTKDGVPVLLSFSDLALMSNLPIPALSKAAPGPKAAQKPAQKDAQKDAPPPPVPVGLDGWAPVANVVRREVTRVPACAAKPKGARFVFGARQLGLRVDGTDQLQPDALYDMRVAPGEACVAAVAALVAPPRRPMQAIPAPSIPSPTKPAGKPAGAAKGSAAPAGRPAIGKGSAAPGPVTFVRVDLTGKRAEGGERGLTGSVRKLTCTLDGKP